MDIAGCPLPRRTDHTISKFKNNLYIFGGTDSKSKSNELYKINLTNRTIRIVEEFGDIPMPRFGHTATVVGTSMYVFGGWDGKETQDELYHFSFSSPK